MLATVRRGEIVGVFLEDPPPSPRIAINRALNLVAIKTRKRVGDFFIVGTEFWDFIQGS